MPSNAVETEAGQKKDFLVVGVGASAGGIKALTALFSGLPDRTGMAFVVILHLSPEHESNLHEILQRVTKMRVRQVTETLHVEPDNVYVIPPAKHLEMVDGVIKVRAPKRVKGVRVPVDRFFRTLAEAYGTKAVAVILSGTGSDGALGMKQIKGRDGFAIVQDPDDAEHDGMPRSAIETRIVDVVLPVAAIPAKLLAVRDSSERLRLTAEGPDGRAVAGEIKNIELLRDVLTLLRVRTGHDFTDYKRPTLVRRIARHLQIHDTDDLAVYLNILREKPEEVSSLLKNLLINVTNFFRDKEAFAALEKKVIPALFEGKTGADSIRVWIAGCASGEEAYSIAILLSEYGGRLLDPPRINVFASDVDDDAITEAREGRFTESILTDVSPERIREFFVKDGDSYRIKKRIREMILFAPHNLLRDPPFSRIDLISCRNVLIYLNRETQERVLQIFHFALRENGHLFLGSSESAEGAAISYAPIDKKHRIYRARPSERNWRIPVELSVGGGGTPLRPRTTRPTGNELQPFGELHRALIERLAPPSILVNASDEILHLSESAGKFLRFAGGEPTSNLLKVIHPMLLSDVRALMFTARGENRTVQTRAVRVQAHGEELSVDLEVQPVELPEPALLIVFREVAEEDAGTPASVQAAVAADPAMESVVRNLEQELRQTKEHLRNTIEQYETSTEELRATNEELQAINEELRSASEELETSKEELQSVNEELATVNHELKDKIDEVSQANSDLQNLMQATDIGTIFLDRGLRIKRFTPGINVLFNIIASDIGRPLEHLTHKLGNQDFTAKAVGVLDSLKTLEYEVQSSDKHFYLVRMSPYRSTEDRIEGVVLAFIDITERRQAERELRFAHARLRMIVESSKDFAIFTTDLDRNVDSWNPGAENMFGYSEEEILGLSADILYNPHDRADGVPVRELQTALSRRRAENERWHVRKDGTLFFGSGLVMPMKDDRGMDMGVVKIMRDLTERKLAQDALRENDVQLRGQRDAFQAAIDGATLRECLDILIRSVTESRGGGLRAVFYLADEAGPTLHPVSDAGGMPVAYLDQVDGIKIGTGALPCGLAVAPGTPVITPDVSASPDWEPHRHLAEEFGIRACWAFPIDTQSGNLVGSFAMYHREPREPTARDIDLAMSVTRAAGLLILRDSEAARRRTAEERLRSNERRLTRMVNMPGIGVLIFDMNGNLLDANDAFLATVGYTREDIRERTFRWQDFTPPEYFSVSEDVVESLRTVGSGGPYEKEYFRKDGSRVWMMFVSADLGDGTIGEYAIDISAQKRGEEAVRESEGRLRALLSNLPGSAVFIVNRDLLYTFAAGEALSSVGVEAGDFIGKTVYEAFDPEEAEGSANRYRLALAGETFVHEHELNGRTFVTRGTPLYSGRDIYAVLAVSHDITDRRVAERKLHEQFDELARFNRAAVDREIRMIELKRQVNELARRMSEPEPYPLDFDDKGGIVHG